MASVTFINQFRLGVIVAVATELHLLNEDKNYLLNRKEKYGTFWSTKSKIAGGLIWS
ncbi:hypothetical protein ABFY60_18160 [Lysinibacillus pakistanensis]|uniref:hypothetical protein n=1 Tax=Lysinibacillus pakistanensis TaxID=759811 RepID=UPI003D2E613F